MGWILNEIGHGISRGRIWRKKSKPLQSISYVISEEDHKHLSLDMTDEQIEAIKNAFAIYDKNNDGTILPKSLIKVLRLLGQNPTEEKVDSILNVVSPNGKRMITFLDFVKIMCIISADIDEVIQEAFSMFDTDGGGTITHEEFRQKMMSSGTDITAEEVNEIIAEADADGDGAINLREFAKMLQQK